MEKDIEAEFQKIKGEEAKNIILKQQMRISEAVTENDALRRALIELQLKVAKLEKIEEILKS